MEIKDRIKHYRLQNNLTQKELSQLTGLSISSIEKYETGDRIPKREALRKIEQVLVYSDELIKKILYYSSKLNKDNQKRVAKYAEILYKSEIKCKKSTDR